MLELLVVDRAHVDVALERLTRDSRREVVLAGVRVAVVDEDLAHVFGLGSSERRTVLELALEDAGFSGEQLEHLADGHTRRETVRVHDDVGADALVVERHVLLRDDETANTLLSVTRGELVAEFGTTSLSQENLDEGRVRVGIRQEDLVDVTRNGAAVRHAGVLPGSGRSIRAATASHAVRKLVVVSVRRSLLVDVHLSGVDLFADVRESVEVENAVLGHHLAILALGRVGQAIVPTNGIISALRFLSLDSETSCRLTVRWGSASATSSLSGRLGNAQSRDRPTRGSG